MLAVDLDDVEGWEKNMPGGMAPTRDWRTESLCPKRDVKIVLLLPSVESHSLERSVCARER